MHQRQSFLSVQNWAWGKENKKSWHKVDSHESIRLFYNHWRGTPFTEKESYPYSLSLGDFAFYPELGSDILVTEAYDTMFHRLLDIRIAHTGCRGAVITGQPGIGASPPGSYLALQLDNRSVLQENPSSCSTCSRG